jgi:transposase InsO family protein
MIALQPSRVTPQSTTVASFSKDSVTYRAVPINQPVVTGKRTSAFPESQRTLDAFKDVDMPMTVQNFKNVDKAVNNKGKGKEVVKPLEQSLASTSSAPLSHRLSSPTNEPLIWCTDEEMYDVAPPKTVEDATIMEEDPYNFDESDEDHDGTCPKQIGSYGWGDTLDADIAEAAGFDTGFMNERQVTSALSLNINSLMQQSAFSAGVVTEQDLHTICSSINKYSVHAANCAKCKGNKNDKDNCQWIMDSGASKHFTPVLSDFADFTPYDGPKLQTAAVKAPLQIKGEGTVFLTHKVTSKSGSTKEIVTRFYPVYHVPGMSVRLMSFGELLQNGCEVRGDAEALRFYKANSRFPSLSVEPHLPKQTIFWLHGSITNKRALMLRNTIDSGDYDLWHKRLGHPSKRVLYETQRHVKNFPKGILFPEKEPLCRGCAEGKMHSRSFPDSQSRATRPFQRIHSDLKSFAVESYHRYRYLISFLDDYTSNAWVVLLRRKDDALIATKNFYVSIETQYKTKIQEWMSDAGGEYKSQEFDDFLKSKGIKILQSVPHQPEQNGRAERFNRTLMDKAQALRFSACLPQSWWEFSYSTPSICIIALLFNVLSGKPLMNFSMEIYPRWNTFEFLVALLMSSYLKMFELISFRLSLS